MFFIDYARKRRVKVFGRGRIVEPQDDPGLLLRLSQVGDLTATRAERSFLVAVEGVDVNCSRHIAPLWNKDSVDRTKALYEQEVHEAVAEAAALRRRVAELEAQLSV